MSNSTARSLPGPLRHFGELYRYREVLYLLIGADMKVRYRRTALGYLWGLLNPLLTIAILTFVFSQLMRFNSTGEYVLYVFAGLLPWQFFEEAWCASCYHCGRDFLYTDRDPSASAAPEEVREDVVS